MYRHLQKVREKIDKDSDNPYYVSSVNSGDKKNIDKKKPNMNEQNNTKQKEWKNREIGALWKRKSDSGKTYCSGHFIVDELGNEVKLKVIMFSNTEKKNEKSPDFLIYLSKDQKSKLSPENPSAATNSALTAPVATNVGDDFEDDNIPM